MSNSRDIAIVNDCASELEAEADSIELNNLCDERAASLRGYRRAMAHAANPAQCRQGVFRAGTMRESRRRALKTPRI